MQAKLQIGELEIDVVLKNVKNIHLSVKPPDGSVAISAPLHMSDNAIRAFAIFQRAITALVERLLRGKIFLRLLQIRIVR